MKKISIVALATVGLSLVAHASIIQPTAVVSEEYVFNSAINTINNYRMTAPVNGGDSLASALAAAHDYSATFDGSFVSDSNGTPLFTYANPGSTNGINIVYDLTSGGDTALGTILMWNYEYNGAGDPTTGGNALRLAEVRVNTEAEGSALFSGSATSITLKPVLDGDAIADNDLGGVNSAQAFALGALSGRYVQLRLTGTYLGHQGITAGGDRVGFGEVRFASDVIPEPATFGLMAVFGGVGLFLRRKMAI